MFATLACLICVPKEVRDLLPKWLRLCILQFLPRASDLRDTPAMEAGIADYIWTPEELVEVLEVR